MITVKHYMGGLTSTTQFPPDALAKVLQSGVLKIVIPAVIEIPDMLGQENGAEVLVIEPERVLAVFNCPYTLQREEGPTDEA